MTESNALSQAEALFSHRAEQVLDPTDRRWLCFVSGRDPRLWTDDMYDDLIESIRLQLGLEETTDLVEVGCAAGFLAAGLAPGVASYTGVDMSRPALSVLESMNLPNAHVIHADGRNLPFDDGSVHAVLCYDVITNFGNWADVAGLAQEVARVLAPGGSWLLGSVPDAQFQRQIETVAQEVGARLDEGDTKSPGRRFALWRRPRRETPEGLPVTADEGAITCYYFERPSFALLAEQLDLELDFLDVHPMSPYLGLRFNALFRKASH